LLNVLKIKIRRVSLFPIYTNKINDSKIYVKHILYLISLLELNNNCKTVKLVLNKNKIVFKKNKNKIQILRSPNRHKKAQFHICKRFYFLVSYFQISWSKINLNNLYLINYINKILLSFESSTMYIKNIKSNLQTYLTLNKIYKLSNLIKRMDRLNKCNDVILKKINIKEFLKLFLQTYIYNLTLNYFFKEILKNNYLY